MEGDLCHRCRWPCRMDLCHRRHRTPRSHRRHAPAGSGRPARWWRADHLRRAFFPSTCRQSWSSRWGVEGVRTFHYREGDDDQHLEHRRGGSPCLLLELRRLNVGSKLDCTPSIQMSTVDPACCDLIPTTSSAGHPNLRRFANTTFVGVLGKGLDLVNEAHKAGVILLVSDSYQLYDKEHPHAHALPEIQIDFRRRRSPATAPASRC